MDGEVESDEFRECSFMVEQAEGTFSFLPWPCRCNGLQIHRCLFHCCVLQLVATITARRTSRATWGWMAARGTVSKPLGEVCTSLHARVLPCCNCKKMHGVIFYLVLGIAQSPGPLFLPPPCSCYCSLNGLASSATKTLFKPKTKMIRQA